MLRLALIALLATSASGAKTVSKLQVGVKHRPDDCSVTAQDGDKVKVHYRGTLLDGGEQFDASYDRGDPFEFVLGAGNVIKGWDIGVAGMCVGEKRKLKIPAAMGYGDRGSPPKIPGGASLVFDVEMLGFESSKKADL